MAKKTLPIHFQNVILHRLNHWQSTKPEHSDFVPSLDSDAEEFLKKHISRVHERKSTKRAVFLAGSNGASEPSTTNNSNPVSRFDAILEEPENFVERSREIADWLFATMLRVAPRKEKVKEDGSPDYLVRRGKEITNAWANPNIIPADLLICTYTIAPSSAAHLAMLKMDAQDGYSSFPVKNNGKEAWGLKEVKGILPTIDDSLNSGLQKAAVILPPDLRDDEGHLLLIDLQGGYTEAVATFFRKDFLQCRTDLNAKDKQQRYIDGENAFFKQTSKEIITAAEQGTDFPVTKEELDSMREASRGELKKDTFDIEEVGRVFKEPTARKRFYEFMQKSEVDGYFDTNEESREWLSKEIVRFKGDRGLEIRIQEGAVGSVLKIKEGNPTIVTIETNKWETSK